MRINNIKGTRMELTPAIREYIIKRVDMLDKVTDKGDSSAWVTVEVGKTSQHHHQGNYFFAEFNVHIAGKDLRAVAEKDDLYAAIDDAKDEIMREAADYKDRQRTMVRRGGAAIKNILKGVGNFGKGIGGKINPFRRFRRK